MSRIQITPTLSIDESEIELHFVRAGGPGGQNVNKVSTAVQLRFDVARSSLPEPVRARLVRAAGKRVSREGILIIQAHRFRTQERNREDAVERLCDLVRSVAVAPRPRLPTGMPRRAAQARLESKQRRGRTKATRGRVAMED
jgi:ribosome-associated protein